MTEVAIQVGSVFVIVTELRKPYHHERDFTDLDLDPRSSDIVIVKIGYLEPELFDMAAGWRLALTPGGVDQDLLRLGHRRIRRPMLATGAEIHALVRCRPGGFVYDAEELATMRRDIQLLVRSGVAGVVIGALRGDGELDGDATRALADSARERADDVQVTFHRAVDRAADPIRLVGTLAGMGIDRILTSGGAPAPQEGTDVLRRMADVRGVVEIMAGGGLAPESIGAVVGAGATSVHLSAKKAVLEVGNAGGGPAVPLGTADPGASHFVTDADTVRRARSVLDALATE